MRPLTIAAALAAAAMTLLAGPGATRHPLGSVQGLAAAVPTAIPAVAAHACDISWFQGTLEEAFTRHAHKDHRALLHF